MDELNVQDLLKKADAQLRQSERQMFSGKKDEAVTLFMEASSFFDRAREVEPANAQLKTLEQKLSKMQKDLEKRIGKPISGSAQPATAEAPKMESPKSEPTKDAAKPNIPYNARKPMQDAQNQLRSIENNFKQLGQETDGGMVKSLLSRIENNIDSGKQYLRDAMDEASKTGAGNHPDFEKIAKDIAGAEAQLNEAKIKASEQNAVSAAKADEVNTDIEALSAEYERLRSVLDKFGIPYYNDLEPLKTQIQTIEDFERNELPGLKEKLSAFESKYGATRDEIDKKTDEAGYSGTTRATDCWVWLTEGIQKIPGTRSHVADELISRMETQIESLKNSHDFFRLKSHSTLREWLEMAKRYNNDSPKVKEMDRSLEGKLKTDKDEYIAKIDKRTWPGNSSDPVSEAALKYFTMTSDRFKTPHPGKVLGIAIHGEWSIQERDILENPVMYGIPVFVAALMDEEKDANLARVYDLTLRTEKKQGAKPEPPFTSDTVGSSYYIRPDKIT